MMYLGDYPSGTTIDFNWSSNAADGSSITRATNGTVSVYKGNNTTQVTTGVTDTEDFDSLTGIHHCRIVTTDAFYATGNDYAVVLSGATIDGKSVNAVLAHFSIQNRYMRGTDGAYTGTPPTPPTTAAIADAVLDEILSGHTTSGSAGKALSDVASAGAPATASDIVDAVLDETLAGHTAAGSVGEALNDAKNGTYIGGSAAAATNGAEGFQGLARGTAITGTLTTSAFTTNLTEATSDHYVGRTLTFISGALAQQMTTILDYNGSTKVMTVTAMTDAPANGDKFVIA
ncbi:MAG: hypothetical protein KC410_19615 [Anaerolineales bacterium]|nr:hypothetical protein [Anaerolineales bacterium]